MDSSPARPHNPKACGTYASQGSRRPACDRLPWIPRPRARTTRRRAGLMRVKVPVAMREVTIDIPWIRVTANAGGVPFS